MYSSLIAPLAAVLLLAPEASAAALVTRMQLVTELARGTGAAEKPTPVKRMPCYRWCKGSAKFMERSCGQADCGGCPVCVELERNKLQKKIEMLRMQLNERASSNGTANGTTNGTLNGTTNSTSNITANATSNSTSAEGIERVNDTTARSTAHCSDYCEKHVTLWMVKCTWTSCRECNQCSLSNDLQLQMDIENARRNFVKPWDLKAVRLKAALDKAKQVALASHSATSNSTEDPGCGDECHTREKMWTIRCLSGPCSTCSMCKQPRELLVRADLQNQKISAALGESFEVHSHLSEGAVSLAQNRDKLQARHHEKPVQKSKMLASAEHVPKEPPVAVVASITEQNDKGEAVPTKLSMMDELFARARSFWSP